MCCIVLACALTQCLQPGGVRAVFEEFGVRVLHTTTSSCTVVGSVALKRQHACSSDFCNVFVWSHTGFVHARQCQHRRHNCTHTICFDTTVYARRSTQAVFTQGSASTVGILLRSWNQAGEGGAAVLFNWETSLLEVVFEALDPATMSFSLTAPLARRVGGSVPHKPGAPLALRLLLDGR